MGAALVRQVASKTNDIAGDGTTTATVLTRAIFSEGCKVRFWANQSCLCAVRWRACTCTCAWAHAHPPLPYNPRAQAVAAGLNPMDLRRGTQLAVDHVVTVLNQISRAVTSKAEVSQVGREGCVWMCV